jgi:RimJ/RimL family protein N-acetyltransferase
VHIPEHPVSADSPITTHNLRLIPHVPQHLLALFEGLDAFRRCSGYTAAEGLTELFTSGEERPEWLARLREASTPDPWTFGFALFHPPSDAVIGTAGFAGQPDADGIVELAYGIAREYRGKGYATEAARALVAFAFASGSVRTVRAHTLPQINPSTRVLTKCGFRRVEDFVDPIDGLVWRWELPLESAAAASKP